MIRRLTLAMLLVIRFSAGANADEAAPVAAPTVAVLSVRISGDAAPELRAQVQESLRSGLASAGYTMVTREQVMSKIADAPELADCTSTTCLQRIGAAVGASQFLRAHVVATGAAYSIRLELLAPEIDNQLKQTVEDKCAVCTISELSDLVSNAAKRLVGVRLQPITIVVITRPQGANLQINGKDVGASPYRGELPPGAHVVSALLPGHLEAEQTIEVGSTEGGLPRFEIILTVAQTTAPPPPAPRFGLWKWVTAGGAVASLATSAVLIALDGDGTCDSPRAECSERYTNLPQGIGGIIIGLGLGAASGWMFFDDLRTERERSGARPARRKPATGAALVPVRGGAVGTVGFTF